MLTWVYPLLVFLKWPLAAFVLIRPLALLGFPNPAIGAFFEYIFFSLKDFVLVEVDLVLSRVLFTVFIGPEEDFFACSPMEDMQKATKRRMDAFIKDLIMTSPFDAHLKIVKNFIYL